MHSRPEAVIVQEDRGRCWEQLPGCPRSPIRSPVPVRAKTVGPIVGLPVHVGDGESKQERVGPCPRGASPRITREEPRTLMDKPPCPFSCVERARARAPGRALSLQDGVRHSSARNMDSSGTGKRSLCLRGRSRRRPGSRAAAMPGSLGNGAWGEATEAWHVRVTPPPACSCPVSRPKCMKNEFSDCVARGEGNIEQCTRLPTDLHVARLPVREWP